MRYRFVSCFMLFLAIAGSTSFACAQEATPKKTPPALQSEEQTAEWARPWWMPRHEAKLKEKGAMNKIDLVWVGDSITHGWEDGGKPVWDKFYANRNALNLGFSGDRTEQVLWRIEHGEFDGVAPKLFIMMIGPTILAIATTQPTMSPLESPKSSNQFMRKHPLASFYSWGSFRGARLPKTRADSSMQISTS